LKDNQILQTVAPASATLQNQTIRPRRILVVDDEPSICHLNVKALSDAGYQVDDAEDGAVA